MLCLTNKCQKTETTLIFKTDSKLEFVLISEMSNSLCQNEILIIISGTSSVSAWEKTILVASLVKKDSKGKNQKWNAVIHEICMNLKIHARNS